MLLITPLQAGVLVLEKGKEQCIEMLCSLLKRMAQTTIITSDQFNQVRTTFLGSPPSFCHILCKKWGENLEHSCFQD